VKLWSWNVQLLHAAGALITLTDETYRCEVDTLTVQEIRLEKLKRKIIPFYTGVTNIYSEENGQEKKRDVTFSGNNFTI